MGKAVLGFLTVLSFVSVGICQAQLLSVGTPISNPSATPTPMFVNTIVPATPTPVPTVSASGWLIFRPQFVDERRHATGVIRTGSLAPVGDDARFLVQSFKKNFDALDGAELIIAVQSRSKLGNALTAPRYVTLRSPVGPPLARGDSPKFRCRKDPDKDDSSPDGVSCWVDGLGHAMQGVPLAWTAEELFQDWDTDSVIDAVTSGGKLWFRVMKNGKFITPEFEFKLELCVPVLGTQKVDLRNAPRFNQFFLFGNKLGRDMPRAVERWRAVKNAVDGLTTIPPLSLLESLGASYLDLQSIDDAALIPAGELIIPPARRATLPERSLCSEKKIVADIFSLAPKSIWTLMTATLPFRGYTTYNGNVTVMDLKAIPSATYAHELGHIFGLADEYVYPDPTSPPNSFFNCRSKSASDPFPGASGPHEGCSDVDHARQPFNGLMYRWDFRVSLLGRYGCGYVALRLEKVKLENDLAFFRHSLGWMRRAGRSPAELQPYEDAYSNAFNLLVANSRELESSRPERAMAQYCDGGNSIP